VPGCVAPIVLGGQERTVIIQLDPEKMATRKISPRDVLTALTKSNILVRPGASYFTKNQILLDSNMVQDLRELNQLPIRSEGDQLKLLGDIGLASDGPAPRATLVRIDGNRTVCVPIYCALRVDADAVRQGIRAELPNIERKLEGTRLKWLSFAHPSQRGDDGLITLRIHAPLGTPLEGTEKRIADVEKFIAGQIPAADLAGIFSEIGVAPDWSAFYTENAGPQDATLRIQLSADRSGTADEYVVRLRHAQMQSQKFADLQCCFTTATNPPIDIQIQSKSATEGMKWAQEVRQRATEVQGAVDVHVVQRSDAPYLEIGVDRDKAAAVGLSAQDVIVQVLTSMNAASINPRDAAGSHSSIRIPYVAGTNLEDLLNAPVAGATGDPPPKLSGLMRLRRSTGPVEIDHVNLTPVVTVRLSVENRRRRRLLDEIEEKLKALQLPAGMSVAIDPLDKR
jgi:multidrug efflux pump subunit AcrB